MRTFIVFLPFIILFICIIGILNINGSIGGQIYSQEELEEIERRHLYPREEE